MVKDFTRASSLMTQVRCPVRKSSSYSTSKRRVCAKKNKSGLFAKSSKGETSSSAQKKTSLLRSSLNEPNGTKKKRIVEMLSRRPCACKKSREQLRSMLLRLKP